MAEANIGVAQLVVDADIQPALTALRKLREELGGGFGEVKLNPSQGVQQVAKQDAEQYKRTFSQYVEQSQQRQLPVRLTPSPAPIDQQRQRDLAAAAKIRRDSLSNALIGGAFPALFGQGIGASFGGAIGGGVGGAIGGQFGFGLSLIGTAVGAQLDALSKRFTDLSAALQDPIKNIDALTQQFILASKAQDSYVKALIESGQTAKASQIIQEQATRSLDPATTASVASATDSYNRNLAQTQNVLGAIVAGPANDFLGFLNNILRVLPGTSSGGASGRRLTSEGARQRAADELYTPVTGALAVRNLGIAPLLSQIRLSNAQRNLNIQDSRDVRRTDTNLSSAEKEQLRLQDAITSARERGNIPLVTALQRQDKLNAATTEYARREREIAVSLAAGDININDSVQQQIENRQTLKLKYDEINAAALDAKRISAQQLADDRRRVELQTRLVSLTGADSYTGRAQLIAANAEAKQLEQRLQLEQAGRNVSTARQAFNEANQNPANAAAIKSASADLDTAVNNYNATRLKTDLESQRIQKETQVQLRDLERQRFAEELAQVNTIKALRLQQRTEAIRPNLSAIGNQSLASASQVVQAQNDFRDAQQNLAKAPEDQTRINAVATAAERLKLAGITFRNNIREAFENAQKQVIELQRGLGQAVVSLAEQQGGSQGINGILSRTYGPAVVQQRQIDSFNTLLPIFQARRSQLADQERQAGRFGSANAIENINFRGSYEGVNKAMIDFIRAVDSEAVAREQIIQSQKDLTKAIAGNNVTAELLNTNLVDLAKVINSLTAKDWNVYVNSTNSNPLPTPPPSQGPTDRTPKLKPLGIF